MSDEETFRDALKVDPTDRTTRLVLADWLDEHERPVEAALQRVLAEPESDARRLEYAAAVEGVDPARAEFVRVQVKLASLPPGPRVVSPIRVEMLPVRDQSLDVLSAFGRVGLEPSVAAKLEYRARIVCDASVRPRPGEVFDVLWQGTTLTGAYLVPNRQPLMNHAPYSGRTCIEYEVEFGHDGDPHRTHRATLLRRERKIVESHGYGFCDDLLGDGWHTCGMAKGQSDVVVSFARGSVHTDRFVVGFARGFADRVECTAAEWLRFGDTIRDHAPVTRVALTTVPDGYGHEDGAEFDGDPARVHLPWVDLERERTGPEDARDDWRPAMLRVRWPGIEFDVPPAAVTPATG